MTLYQTRSALWRPLCGRVLLRQVGVVAAVAASPTVVCCAVGVTTAPSGISRTLNHDIRTTRHHGVGCSTAAVLSSTTAVAAVVTVWKGFVCACVMVALMTAEKLLLCWEIRKKQRRQPAWRSWCIFDANF